MQTKPIESEENDIVMVDADPAVDESKPENIQFDENPAKPLKRSSTTPAKKSSDNASKSIGGLFGFGKKTRRPSESAADGPKSSGRGLTDDEAISTSRRKRTAPGSDDVAKRLRREERKVRRSGSGREPESVPAPDDGFVTEADLPPPVDDEQARREERRRKRAERDAAAREAELKDAEERRARRKEADKSKAREAKDRKRREDEREAIKDAERRQRRKDREEMNAKIEASMKRRHTSDFSSGGAAERLGKGGKSERRKSSFIPTSGAANDRPKSSRRKSTLNPIPDTDDYFSPNAGDEATKGGNYVYPQHGNDPTSSWVKSQISDPPAPPPVDPTVIDVPPPVEAGESSKDATTAAAAAKDLEEEAATRRAMRRKSKRQSTFVAPGDGAAGGGEEDRQRERRRRHRESAGSEHSAGEQAGSRRGLRRSATASYAERPSLGGGGGKRGSWLKKVTGF